MKTFLQLREASNRTKRNPTRDFLRRYPVSDAEMAKPVKKPEKKKEEKQGVVEVAFKDPSPMMKDSIKQDKIRSLKNLIAVAKVKGIHHKVKEYESELKKLKETTEVTEAGPFSYGAKPPRKGSVAYNALMQRKEQDKKRVKEIEAIGTKNHHVGIAKVTKVTKEEIEDVNNLEEGSKSETEGMVSYIHHIIKNHVYPRAGDKETYMKHVAKEMPSIVKSNPKLFRRAHSIAYDRFFHVDKNNNNDYDHTDHSMRQGEMGHRKGMSEAKDEMYKYIDQSGGHQIKGKSGTYVGYTHSATKGKGANILKHNQTKKYYAAGGSSTAFTQKTTLHDTPEAAAKAYHKGNLAESTETPEHHFEKSLDHYQKAKEALGRGDHEKHQYHAAMGDIHRERVSQHLDQAHKKREPTSHIYKMWSHLSNEHQKHVDIRRNKEWEDEKNQSIQRGREFMDRAGEPSDFEMKDGKLHAKYKPKYDYRTGKKL